MASLIHSSRSFSTAPRHWAVALLLAVLAVLVPGQARAADGPGTKVVRAANVTIATLLKQQVIPGSPEEKKLADKVTESVRGFLDLDELGMRALGDEWKQRTPAEQAEYLATLRALIEDNYVKGLRANLDYEVVYLAEAAAPAGNLKVSTEIKTKRKGRAVSIKVDYVLRKDAAGKLRCFDVVTDKVSLVSNYRAQFTKIIKKDGFPALIAKMKKKLGK